MTEHQPNRVEVTYDDHVTIYDCATKEEAAEKFKELYDTPFTELWFFAYNMKMMGFDQTTKESNQ